MADDAELTLTATGQIRSDTTADTDSMHITESTVREVSAEIALDADRLCNSDIATTHKQGSMITRRDVANAVADELDVEPVETDDWELTLAGPLDDWQRVALGAADKKRMTESKSAATAIDVLLSLHEDHAETDRPILAAINIDETFDVGRRDELLGELESVGNVLQAKTEGVNADV
ncbi:hypothetical protein FK85_05475 [Halorubrum saccharovorum]|uniref:Uncharacterized protein n=1 Tax=Halorubrum saccharovorum TaxID=2248 RepID=A0A081EUT8_9EURY|nr:hypothetical protein [Halorubrum saccharovorum]KDS91176.1 hypothetical protein FK85_05475 [Halorubrum saccharovorum]